jgi:hypothetical protein
MQMISVGNASVRVVLQMKQAGVIKEKNQYGLSIA